MPFGSFKTSLKCFASLGFLHRVKAIKTEKLTRWSVLPRHHHTGGTVETTCGHVCMCVYSPFGKQIPQRVRKECGIVEEGRREVWENQAGEELFPCLLTQQIPDGPACVPGIQVVGRQRGQTGQHLSICASLPSCE